MLAQFIIQYTRFNILEFSILENGVTFWMPGGKRGRESQEFEGDTRRIGGY